MNPIVITFWMLSASIGYLIGETLYSAVVGLTITLSITFIIDLFTE